MMRRRIPSSKSLSRRAPRHGAVTVEFAIVASIFFVLCMGAIEFARVNIVSHVVDNVAYDAARMGIAPGADVTDVQAQAIQHLTNANLQGAQVTVTPDPIEENAQVITATITVPMDQNTWVVPSFTSGAQIVGSASLRAERFRGR